MKVRHLGLFYPASSSLLIAGWDDDQDFEDKVMRGPKRDAVLVATKD